MFTGIVQEVGTVTDVRHGAESRVLTVEAPAVAALTEIGDSVCIGGACLTATALDGAAISFDVSAETVRLTTLAELRRGDLVNVEPSLRMGDKIGGHFMSGHVDGVGVIRELRSLPGETRLRVEVDKRLTDDMIMKGSVGVAGISLTIAALEDGAFEVAVIPHTMAVTTLHSRGPGDRVNIECDMIGRWVRRLLGDAGVATGGPVTLQQLEEGGF